MKVSGNIVDIIKGVIYAGTIEVQNGIITNINSDTKQYDRYILPGFIDAHVHVESSMLTPSEFARLAAVHGTVAAVSDPHEIANVLGIDGIRYMVENGNKTPFLFSFGAPSCVPATPFETAGSALGLVETEMLLSDREVGYLSEMMNFPGVISGDEQIMAKISLARKYGKPIDGHAPGLTGEALRQYVAAGITTDHECITREEAIEKIGLGMKILIREGSAAKNFDALHTLIDAYPEFCMFCSDDKHPDDLAAGHIDDIVRKAVASGLDVMKVLRSACLNPALHYSLGIGLLQKGQRADFIVIDSLVEFTVLQTYIGGELVATEGNPLISRIESSTPNHFTALPKSVNDFRIPQGGDRIRIIEILENQLVTGCLVEKPLCIDGSLVADPSRDILKIAVINRYEEMPPALGFIRGFGLANGAIASSVAHDSHNIIIVGTNDEFICRAANLIIKQKGGICAVSNDMEKILSLPVAGILSDGDSLSVAGKYESLNGAAKMLGTKLHAPFMTLSFMALLVIPRLKLSDKGLFDGEVFQFVDLFP